MKSPTQQPFPKLSVNKASDQQFHDNQADMIPSMQAQRLINYLKSNPNPDLNRKLREQIFFRKIQKADKKDQLKKSSSQTRLTQHINGAQINSKNGQALRTDKLKQARFFSPKIPKRNFDDIFQSKLIKPFPIPQKQIKLFNRIDDKMQRCKIKSKIEHISQNKQQCTLKFEAPTKQSKTQKFIKDCPQFIKNNNNKNVHFRTSKVVSNTSISSLDFKFLKFLGQGTFGEVFLTIHKKTRSIFTIKRYKKQIIKSHQLENKFIHDIKTQYRMNDPYIVKMYGFFDDQAFIYMIFQCMESGSLSKMIQQVGGRLSQGQISRTILQINQAVFNLHQKRLIHRDIKPSSILTCFKVCKLCDTQWIQQIGDKHKAITLCKQIDYAAPEALQGKQITPEFDVWSLGLIIFQLLTGKKLITSPTQKGLIRKIITFKSEHIDQQIPVNCPSYLRELLIRALNPIPSKRITSKLISQLQVLKAHEPQCIFNQNFKQIQGLKKQTKIK